MTRKNHLCLGSLCVGLALCFSAPATAGWGSSFGSGGSHGSTGSSYGSFGSTGRSVFSHGYVSHGSHGSLGSHGSRGSWGGGSSGGSWGSAGGSSGGYASSGGSGLFHGGLINRLRAHHHRKSWFGSHGSSGGSWGGSHGSSGGSWGGSHHASHGSSGGSTGGGVHYYQMDDTMDEVEGAVIEGEEVTDEGEAPIPTAPLDTAGADSKAGSLLVTLPANAKLYVNGQKTKSTGPTRHFVSKGLKPGFRYAYDVTAVHDVDGREVVRRKQTSLHAGESNRLSFDFDTKAETRLTVLVPADATLKLAGTKTKSTGSKRTFATTKLTEGQIWSDYRIVVSLEKNGRTITREQTIELRCGEDRTLSFDFDAQQVAAR